MVSPPWVILGSVPRVSDDDDEPQRLSLDLAPPPRVSIVTVPWRVAPDPTTPANFPAFRAADPSAGLLLLVASQGTLAAAGRTMGDDDGLPTHSDPDIMLPAYFVCDLASATAFRLPDPHVAVSYHRNQALIAIPGGHYMVAHLRAIDAAAADHATLLCFWSDTAEWVEKTLPLLHDGPFPRKFDPSNTVFTHDAKLWWVDLSRGLLTCDPFADQPLLRFLPLPPGKSKPPSIKIDKYRCVKVSAGKLRFVDIDRRAAKVTMWTLANHEEWVLEYQLSFQHLRADVSYKAAGLKEDSDPVLAFVHPTNPDVVYFFMEENLVGVDMRAIKVVDCDVCRLVLPPMEFVSSGFVIACELPPSISTDHIVGLPGKVTTDTTVAEEPTSQPSLLSASATK